MPTTQFDMKDHFSSSWTRQYTLDIKVSLLITLLQVYIIQCILYTKYCLTEWREHTPELYSCRAYQEVLEYFGTFHRISEEKPEHFFIHKSFWNEILLVLVVPCSTIVMLLKYFLKAMTDDEDGKTGKVGGGRGKYRKIKQVSSRKKEKKTAKKEKMRA